jgi:hypothetical protein
VGQNDTGGNGFRLYDRSDCNKAMVFIPRATHDRFNSIWAANEAIEWPTTKEGIALPGVPARALSKSTHESLAQEFIGGFFDLILNSNAVEQPRFRGEIKSPTGASVAHQWHFASATEAIDNFTSTSASDLGVRTLPAGAAVSVFAPLKPVTTRDERVPHDDHACILNTSAAGKPTIIYEFTTGAPTAWDAVRFRLGRVYPSPTKTEIDSAVTQSPAAVDVAKLKTLLSTKQTAIDAVNPPDFEVIFEDTAGQTVHIAKAAILSNQKNGWARPEAKVPVEIIKNSSGTFAVAGDSTLMWLQTMQITSAQVTGVDQGKLKKISFEFTVPAAATEIWLDSIEIIIN